jgi:hypothetical protein
MNEKFKDQANYLIGFLAALIGLSFFKTELGQHNINIFSYYPSFLNLGIFIIGMLLLSAYFGALAHLINNFNVTSLPLSGLLSLLSNIFSTIGLIAPVMFLLGYVLTLIPISRIQSTQVSGLAALLTAVLGFLAGRAKDRNEKRQIAQQATTIIYPDNVHLTMTTDSVKIKNKTKNESSRENNRIEEQFIVNSYSSLIKFISNYLYIRGFGVKGEDLVQMAHILVSKNVFNNSDVIKAQQIMDLRNKAAHSEGTLAKADLYKAQDNLLVLYKKVQKAYLRYLGAEAGKHR